MVVSTSAIVISKLKYKDNDLILKLLTRELGVCNFLVRNPAGKKRNKIIIIPRIKINGPKRYRKILYRENSGLNRM